MSMTLQDDFRSPSLVEQRTKMLNNIADLIEMEGHVDMSDLLRESKDTSLVKLYQLEPIRSTSHELHKRNPEIPIERFEEMAERRSHLVVLAVGEREVLIHEDVARQIDGTLSGVL